MALLGSVLSHTPTVSPITDLLWPLHAPRGVPHEEQLRLREADVPSSPEQRPRVSHPTSVGAPGAHKEALRPIITIYNDENLPH